MFAIFEGHIWYLFWVGMSLIFDVSMFPHLSQKKKSKNKHQKKEKKKKKRLEDDIFVVIPCL